MKVTIVLAPKNELVAHCKFVDPEKVIFQAD